MRARTSLLVVIGIAMLLTAARPSIEAQPQSSNSTVLSASLADRFFAMPAEPPLASTIFDTNPAAQQGPPVQQCAFTITCGGCCGTNGQVQAFVRCCDREQSPVCRERFACSIFE